VSVFFRSKKHGKKQKTEDASDLADVNGNDVEAQAEQTKPTEEPFHYQVLGQDTFDDLKKLRCVSFYQLS
jgi:hypothetical protein